VQAATANHSPGISIVAFLVAGVVSLAYYQFVYVPEVNAKPILPKAVLEPKESFQVTIVDGAWQESSHRNYVPKNVRGVLGLSNRVVWTNTDSIGHTVTTGDEYVDKISGKFNSNEQLGRLINPGETFEFTFTKVGEYPYSCVPHPHMQGKIEIVSDFS
jgi:plastocyanin